MNRPGPCRLAFLLTLSLIAAGCGDSGGDAAVSPPDAAGARDLAVAVDVGVDGSLDFAAFDSTPQDLLAPDLAMPDLAMPDLARPPVYTPSGCDLIVNTNAGGTVNPFVAPARLGRFYVSYASTPGDLQLATVDPKACKRTAGPLQVNSKGGEVYFYGAQSVNTDPEGNFYAVWEEQPGSHVGFAWSKDGMTFTETPIIESVSENGVYPSLFVTSAGVVHVAWSGLFQGQYDPFYSRNDQAFLGGSWTKASQVTSTKTQDDATAIAVDSVGRIYLAWVTFDSDLFVARSIDNGKTWGMPVRANDVAGKASAGIGSFLIVSPDDSVHVSWSDKRVDPEGDVYTDTSGPNGLAFGADVKVNDDGARYQEDPSLAVGSAGACKGVIYAVWQDLRSNKDYDIYASRSADGGKTWDKNVVATPKTQGDQMNPAIAVDGDCTVGVSWRDSSANPKFDVKATFLTW